MFGFIKTKQVKNAVVKAMVEFFSINFNTGEMEGFAISLFDRHKDQNSIKAFLTSGEYITPHSISLCILTMSLFDEMLLNNPEVHITIHKGIVDVLKVTDYSTLCLENKTACVFIHENISKIESISDVGEHRWRHSSMVNQFG